MAGTGACGILQGPPTPLFTSLSFSPSALYRCHKKKETKEKQIPQRERIFQKELENVFIGMAVVEGWSCIVPLAPSPQHRLALSRNTAYQVSVVKCAEVCIFPSLRRCHRVGWGGKHSRVASSRRRLPQTNQTPLAAGNTTAAIRMQWTDREEEEQ